MFVWLDILAINQADPGVDLDGGRTLSKTIDGATATLVVLDRPVPQPDGTFRGLVPLTRLWCLYEIGNTPNDKLALLTGGFDQRVRSEEACDGACTQCADMTHAMTAALRAAAVSPCACPLPRRAAAAEVSRFAAVLISQSDGRQPAPASGRRTSPLLSE